jgi:hypothetical protein
MLHLMVNLTETRARDDRRAAPRVPAARLDKVPGPRAQIPQGPITAEPARPRDCRCGSDRRRPV